MKTINIFIGEQKIQLISTSKRQKLTLFSGTSVDAANCTQEELRNYVFSFMQQQKNHTLHIFGPPAKVLKRIITFFFLIEAAGGLIENKQGKMLFIYRRGYWDLPKGKIDEGETPRRAAVRECEEECAIEKLKIERKIADTWHIYTIGEQWIIKKTYWYFMRTTFSGKLIPQREEGIQKVEWIAKSKQGSVLKKMYPALVELLYDFYRKKRDSE